MCLQPNGAYHFHEGHRIDSARLWMRRVNNSIELRMVDDCAHAISEYTLGNPFFFSLSQLTQNLFGLSNDTKTKWKNNNADYLSTNWWSVMIEYDMHAHVNRQYNVKVLRGMNSEYMPRWRMYSHQTMPWQLAWISVIHLVGVSPKYSLFWSVCRRICVYTKRSSTQRAFHF